eukprot:TRINITY_DN4302_c0_g4_i1.p1 TRINITY_DN4302_c0_g4~~TRINITY_DN4302_c0_g4_i1.p1  ORF type:complete len:343 (+),score=107.22 TRINITY_DN4302_c0_g4_i1:94-1029(+)
MQLENPEECPLLLGSSVRRRRELHGGATEIRLPAGAAAELPQPPTGFVLAPAAAGGGPPHAELRRRAGSPLRGTAADARPAAAPSAGGTAEQQLWRCALVFDEGARAWRLEVLTQRAELGGQPAASPRPPTAPDPPQQAAPPAPATKRQRTEQQQQQQQQEHPPAAPAAAPAPAPRPRSPPAAATLPPGRPPGPPAPPADSALDEFFSSPAPGRSLGAGTAAPAAAAEAGDPDELLVDDGDSIDGDAILGGGGGGGGGGELASPAGSGGERGSGSGGGGAGAEEEEGWQGESGGSDSDRLPSEDYPEDDWG